MKVNPSVKRICDKCKVIRRHGRVMVSVVVELSPYDLSRGRIVYRYK